VVGGHCGPRPRGRREGRDRAPRPGRMAPRGAPRAHGTDYALAAAPSGLLVAGSAHAHRGKPVVRVAAELTAAGFAWLFLLAFLGKVDSWAGWRSTVTRLFSRRVRRALLVGVPLAEAATSGLLILAPRGGLVVAAGLLAAFGVGVILLARWHRGLDCSCFGALAPSSIGGRLGVRDLLLSVIAAAAAFLIEGAGIRRVNLGELLLAAVAGTWLMVAGEAKRLRQASRSVGVGGNRAV